MDNFFNEMRYSIKNFLKSNYDLDRAADLASDLVSSSYNNAAKHYNVGLADLYKKVEYRRKINEFNENKLKYDAAVAEYLTETVEAGTVKSIQQIADERSIPFDLLNMEITKAQTSGLDAYSYDKIVNSNDSRTFSYMQEILLFRHLETWKEMQGPLTCTCELCALEQLLIFAYNAKTNEEPSSSWNFGQADVEWLKEFQMRYSKELIATFGPFTICCRESSPSG